MDSIFDWKVDQPIIGHNHYDARMVRSCRPGYGIDTDPGGDGWWSEGNWAGETPEGAQRGGGQVISDSNLSVVANEKYDDAGGGALPNPAPKTKNNGSVRVRTRYENPSVAIYSCNPLPANDPEYHGCN